MKRWLIVAAIVAYLGCVYVQKRWYPLPEGNPIEDCFRNHGVTDNV